MDRTKLICEIMKASNVTINEVKKWSKESEPNKIPHIIHFCFCDYENIPEKYLNMIGTWFDKMPDWHYVNWTPNNIDITKIPWLNFMYDKHKFAFFADYIRLFAVYNFGGFYMDCDVVCHNSLERIDNFAYIFDREIYTLSDLVDWDAKIDAGSFGSQKNNSYLKSILNYYDSIDIKEYKDMSNKELSEKLFYEFIAPIVWKKVADESNIEINYDYEGLTLYSKMVDSEKTNIKKLNTVYVLNSTYLSMGDQKNVHNFNFSWMPWSLTSHMFANEWSKPENMQ